MTPKKRRPVDDTTCTGCGRAVRGDKLRADDPLGLCSECRKRAKQDAKREEERVRYLPGDKGRPKGEPMPDADD